MVPPDQKNRLKRKISAYSEMDDYFQGLEMDSDWGRDGLRQECHSFAQKGLEKRPEMFFGFCGGYVPG